MAEVRARTRVAGPEDSEADWVDLYVSMGLSEIEAASLAVARREANDRDVDRRSSR